MIGKILATTALLLVVTGSAQAQSAAGPMLASGYQMAATDALASKLIGSAVFSTIATNDGAATTAPAATTGAANAPVATNANGAPATSPGNANAQQIGTVRDLVVTNDGKVAAVVIGIGGFLGMGEKNVTVTYSDLKWAAAQDGSIRGTMDTTVDALKAAPDFAYPANKQATNAAPPANGGNVVATPSVMAPVAPSAMAPATPASPNAAATAANANGGMDVSKLKPSNMTAMKTDDLKGADLLDPSGQKIASINDLVLGSDGKVDAVIVDFGGFLGIGTKQIALAYEGLQFMDDANGKHYLVVNLTKDQLGAQKAYNKDDYATNRDAERLVVGSAGGKSAMAATKTSAAMAVTTPADFATKAAPANMFEIMTSKLALTKSQNADIKAFAQKMIDDHTKAGQAMAAAAATEKVTPPTSLDASDQAKVDDLSKLSGDAFDKAYVAAQVKAHADAVALFQAYSTNGPAGALKDFAGKTLPTLQMHYEMAQKLPQ